MTVHLLGSRLAGCRPVLQAQRDGTQRLLTSYSSFRACPRQSGVQRPKQTPITVQASQSSSSGSSSSSSGRTETVTGDQVVGIRRSAQAALAGALLSSGASLGMVSAALADGTDAAAMSAALSSVPSAAQTQASGFNAFESLLILAPIVLYGVFNVYRAKINPKAKLSDFFFIAAGVAVVGNLLSILVFRRRFF